MRFLPFARQQVCSPAMYTTKDRPEAVSRSGFTVDQYGPQVTYNRNVTAAKKTKVSKTIGFERLYAMCVKMPDDASREPCAGLDGILTSGAFSHRLPKAGRWSNHAIP
jgi:hypothetical protein